MKILGINVHAFTLSGLNEYITAISRDGGHHIISNVNVHAFNLANGMPWLRTFFNHQSDKVFCDGHGVMLGARMLGHRIPEKITYAHWFPLFCDFAADRGLTIFLLGSKPGISQLAKDKLCENRPGLKIVGALDGYFDKTPGCDENERVISQINAVKPNVLLVAFGMPLQEKWLAENWDRIDANVALTGGAAIDYMAGVSKRPPKWLTATGFEWLGRMLYEPKRLWRRYLLGNPLFIWRVLKQKFGIDKYE